MPARNPLSKLSLARGIAFAALMLAAAAALAQSSQTLKAFGVAPGALGPEHLAVVINSEDANSREIGEYYVERRQIPAANVIRVALPAQRTHLSPQAFAEFRAALFARIAPEIQAILLVWSRPYAVDCQSITAALSLGLNPELCSQTCAPSRPNPYFDSRSRRPAEDHGLRPAMLLPAHDTAQARALIDRGIAADGRLPRGTAYLLQTSDPHRNTRAPFFPPAGVVRNPPLTIRPLKAEYLEGARDIMFYFTGQVRVDKLETLHFLPGALADHLTSAGGNLFGGSQMSSLRWLEAGATGSYGTVSEPCNHWQKFPNPVVAMRHYLRGETLIEAYWKSVAWPDQGLFIGDPLAAPYRRK